MAVSVEVGPGIRLAAPSMSRNCCRSTQRRLWTTSVSNSAMCAAGPPKPITPSLRKRPASSRSRVARESFGGKAGAVLCRLTDNHRGRSWELRPDTIRNSRHINMAKSVRASLTMYQNPWPACLSSGIFVVAIAVLMMTSSRIAANRVNNPIKTSSPHPTSNPPTKWATAAGWGKPRRVKRSTPMCASVNLRIPWVRKMSPTARRMKMVALCVVIEANCVAPQGLGEELDRLFHQRGRWFVGISRRIVFDGAIFLVVIFFQSGEGLCQVHARSLALLVNLAVFHVTDAVGMGKHGVHSAILEGFIMGGQGVAKVGQRPQPRAPDFFDDLHDEKWIFADRVVVFQMDYHVLFRRIFGDA